MSAIPPPTTRWQLWAQRLAGLALIGALALIMLRHVRSFPSDVEVSYVLGNSRHELRRLVARYVDAQGHEGARFERRFGGASTPATASHALKLADGEYRVQLLLTYAQRATQGNETRINLLRSLTVKGPTQLKIFVGAEAESGRADRP